MESGLYDQRRIILQVDQVRQSLQQWTMDECIHDLTRLLLNRTKGLIIGVVEGSDWFHG